jgi:hypothetical protein
MTAFRPSAIRNLQVTDSDLFGANVDTFARVFSPVTMKPHEAKEMRGSVVVTSLWCDKDPRPNWQIPEWRAFAKCLFTKVPHFSYFVVGMESYYAGLVYAVLPDEVVLSKGVDQGVVTQAVVKALVGLLGPVVEYCERIEDDAGSVFDYLLQGFPPGIAGHVRLLFGV